MMIFEFWVVQLPKLFVVAAVVVVVVVVYYCCCSNLSLTFKCCGSAFSALGLRFRKRDKKKIIWKSLFGQRIILVFADSCEFWRNAKCETTSLRLKTRKREREKIQISERCRGINPDQEIVFLSLGMGLLSNIWRFKNSVL